MADENWVPHVSALRGLRVGNSHGSRRTGRGGGSGGGGTGVATGARVEPQAIVAAPLAPSVWIAARIREYRTPGYPRAARERGLEGLVRLEVDVAADGTVAEVRIVESSGLRAFDEAAIKSVRGWRFDPATVDGEAVASTLALPPIRFRLE